MAEADGDGESGLFDAEVAGSAPCFSAFGIDQDRQRPTYCYQIGQPAERRRLAFPIGTGLQCHAHGGGELPLPERFDDPTFASQIHFYKAAKDFMWA